jgi:hypothetical protein
MQEQTQTATTTLVLPIAVVSPMDIARLIRELDNLDEFFRQAAIRQGGTPQSLPRYSRLLDEVVVANGFNLLDGRQREVMLLSLRSLASSAPVLHISFSVDPPGPYVQKIVAWLRESIDPLILVRVGLQPNIGAGCVVRTPNHSFDFSLRKYFDSKHEFFMKKLHEVVSPELQASVYGDSSPVTEQTAVETVPQPTEAPVAVDVMTQPTQTQEGVVA